MRCRYDEETLKLIALAIGTSMDRKEMPSHHLRYLALKLVGKDGLQLDLENEDIFQRLKAEVEDCEEL